MQNNEEISRKVLERVNKDQGLLTKIASVFPGYHGYKKKELIRGADDIIRHNTFRILEDASANLRESYRIAVRYSLMDEVKEIESLYFLCDSLAQTILHAPRGYKPIVGATRINEEDLKKLVRFDASLADIIKDIKEKTAEIPVMIARKDRDSLRSALLALRTRLEELSTLMKRREALLEGYMQ